MTVLGFWITVMALIASLVSMVLYARQTGSRPESRSPYRWLLASALSIAVASFLLMMLLLQHDFTNGYVYSYSSKSLPLHYLLSSFYAGQEGSFLFWALCSVLISLFLARSTRRAGIEPHVMAVYMGVQAFLLLLLIAKSPFRSVWEMIPGAPLDQVPIDGTGLNPLLQNFWMTIHPPVLFIGFAAMAVPFSYAVAGLWKKHFSILVDHGFAWVLSAVLWLGLGIMIGAYWAYGVLGWGGYWGWDPVENSSLVPWLTGMALIHTMIAQRRTKAFLRTNLFLAIISYALVVYSTFLTRSGVLGDSSVHSFTDPGTTVYSLLVMYVVSLAATGLGLMYLRRKMLSPPASDGVPALSKEMMLGVGSGALILTAAVVLFGTSLPIFSAKTVEPAFYDTTTLPLGILMTLLLGFSLYTQWGMNDVSGSLSRALKSAAVSIVATAVLVMVGMRDPWMILFAFAAVFSAVVNIELAWNVRKGGLRPLGGKIAHIGLAVFFLGVIATGKHSMQRDLSLELNTPQEALGFTFTYTGYSPLPDGKFAFHVTAEQKGRRIQLAPVMFDAGNQGLMRNPDIDESFLKDIYLSPVALNQGSEHHHHESVMLPKGETVEMGDVKARFVRFEMEQHGMGVMMGGAEGMRIGSVLELTNGTATETVTPVAVHRNDGETEYPPTPSKLLNGNIQLVSMNVGMGGGASTVTVQVHNHAEEEQGTDALIVEASVKPFVSLLWIGTVLMFGGIVLSIIRRAKE